MKKVTLGAFALASFFAAMTAEISSASAAVACGPRGCVAARRPVVVHRRPVVVHRPMRCRWVWVRGVRVRRCW